MNAEERAALADDILSVRLGVGNRTPGVWRVVNGADELLASLATAEARIKELEGEVERLAQQMYEDTVPKGEANQRIAREQQTMFAWVREMQADRDSWQAIAERLGEALRLSARGANPDTGVVLRALDEMKEGAE